jgi:hypothetical protein
MSHPNRQKVWQLLWHEILNDYPDPDGGASITPDPLPDLDWDFRLHFNLSQVPQEARQRAFAILPCGNEMLARVERHLSAQRRPLEPEQAIGVLRTGLRLAQDAGVRILPGLEMNIEIVSEADIPLLDAFTKADDPFYDIRDRLSAGASACHGEIGLDAYFFLSEPLYRLRSSYHSRDWVLWPLCSHPAAADLTEAGYLLQEGGWSPGWTDEKLFIFDRRKEFGLS